MKKNLISAIICVIIIIGGTVGIYAENNGNLQSTLLDDLNKESVELEASLDSRRELLYIASGSPGYLSTYETLNSFGEEVGGDYQIFVRYYDSHNTEEKLKIFKESIESTLDYHDGIKATVAHGDMAASFVLENYELFEGMPVFLAGIIDEKIKEDGINKGVSAIYMSTDTFKKNVEMIYRMYKDTRDLVVVTGSDELYEDIIEEYKQLDEKYKEMDFRRITLTYTNKSEVIEKLSKVDSDKEVILYCMPRIGMLGGELEFRSTEFSNLGEITRLVRSSTDAPIFSDVRKPIENGMLGGYTSDLKEEGKISAVILRQILEKKKQNQDTKIYDFEDIITGKLAYNKVSKTNANVTQIPEDAEKLYVTSNGYVNHELVYRTIFISILIIVAIFVKIICELRRQKKVNSALRAAKELAEDMNSSKNNLMSNISHELKTPVTVIHSSSQLLQKLSSGDEPVDNKILNYNLDIIDKNTARLMRLINNIIDVSKVENGFDKLNACNVEVVSFIEEIVFSVVPYAENKDLDFLFDTEIEELIMAVDINKIERIVLNLLSNAIKFSKSGTMFYVDLSVRENNLSIKVKDQGIGMKETDLDFIFDKFAQVDNKFTRLTEGSGIGLTLVKVFTELHGGKVTVESELGVGSTFEVLIPINVIPDQEILYNVPRDERATVSELSDIYL